MFKSYFLLKKYYKKHQEYDLPFASSQYKRVKAMLKLSKIKKGEKSIDLGAGDGKVVIAFAKNGAIAYGIEIDPTLAELAKHNIRKNGLFDKAFIIYGNFWEHPLSQYDIISVYGMRSIMGRLERKIQTEAKVGCRILCNYFPFPVWKPETEEEKVFLYVK